MRLARQGNLAQKLTDGNSSSQVQDVSTDSRFKTLQEDAQNSNQRVTKSTIC